MHIVVLIHVGLALWLFRFLMNNDRGSKEPIGPLRVVACFGALAGLFGGYLNEALVPSVVLDHLDDPSVLVDNGTLALGGLIIGLNEELIKFLPAALFVYKKGYFNELTDGVIYFGLAGMWFGVIENITYGMLFGVQVGIYRAVMTPFIHAGFTALAGIGLARMKLLTKNPISVVGWLGLAVLTHAVYDFLIFTGNGFNAILALLLGISVNLVVFKVFRVAQAWDEKRGMSAVGHNNFCRNCGQPNPQKHLFCTRCGKHT